MNREQRRKQGIVREKTTIQNATDPVLQPLVIENKGNVTVYFTSKLEFYHPNLIEDTPTFELKPGEACIQPHGYYEGVTASGQAQVEHYPSGHPKAIEALKDYKKMYRKRFFGATNLV